MPIYYYKNKSKLTKLLLSRKFEDLKTNRLFLLVESLKCHRLFAILLVNNDKCDLIYLFEKV